MYVSFKPLLLTPGDMPHAGAACCWIYKIVQMSVSRELAWMKREKREEIVNVNTECDRKLMLRRDNMLSAPSRLAPRTRSSYMCTFLLNLSEPGSMSTTLKPDIHRWAFANSQHHVQHLKWHLQENPGIGKFPFGALIFWQMSWEPKRWRCWDAL